MAIGKKQNKKNNYQIHLNKDPYIAKPDLSSAEVENSRHVMCCHSCFRFTAINCMLLVSMCKAETESHKIICIHSSRLVIDCMFGYAKHNYGKQIFSETMQYSCGILVVKPWCRLSWMAFPAFLLWYKPSPQLND